jgi:transcriptional regulator with XRE-family HTH domain
MQLGCIPFRKGVGVPRPNRGRTLASEANLAKRIAYERDRRGLSYEALAAAMTEQGCAIQGSAIYKIEKGDPPRRVTVDELVALAGAFDTTIDELLTPVELLEQLDAKRLIDELDHVTHLAVETAVRLSVLWVEYIALTLNNPELGEYVEHHWAAAAEIDFPVAAFTEDGETVSDDPSLNDVVADWTEAVRKVTEITCQRVMKLGNEDVLTALNTGKSVRRAVKAQVK